MITIKKSPTADTRTCDASKVTKQELLDSSRQHINDVRLGLASFAMKLLEAASVHDLDKITEIGWFHEDFKTGFEKTGWWDNHRRINRHHLNRDDGVPADVNLVDVIEYITDCVMAGKARSGEVYPIEISHSLLLKAFENTVEMLKNEVVLES